MTKAKLLSALAVYTGPERIQEWYDRIFNTDDISSYIYQAARKFRDEGDAGTKASLWDELFRCSKLGEESFWQMQNLQEIYTILAEFFCRHLSLERSSWPSVQYDPAMNATISMSFRMVYPFTEIEQTFRWNIKKLRHPAIYHIVGGAAHECWHAKQNIDTREFLAAHLGEEAVTYFSSIPVHEAPRGAYYYLNDQIYIDGSDSTDEELTQFCRSQIKEAEADFFGCVIELHARRAWSRIKQTDDFPVLL